MNAFQIAITMKFLNVLTVLVAYYWVVSKNFDLV